jgi:signal transduction histidine kinase
VTAFLLAVAGTALLVLVSFAFRSSVLPGGFLFSTLIVVIVVTAIGGIWPGFAAVALGILARIILSATSAKEQGPGLEPNVVSLTTFAVVGVAIAFLIGKLAQLAEEHAESRTALAASRARIVAAADEARRRIERDLHDGTQQQLVTLLLDLRGVQEEVPPQLDELEDGLARIAGQVMAVIDQVREISRGIHPVILSEGGLPAALKMLARQSAVPVQLDLRAGLRLPPPVEVAAYYAVSEALANAAKHARASAVHVKLDMPDTSVRLTIRDDGTGGADPARGSGLIGLGDRIETLGGTLHVSSPVGGGTTLLIELPAALRTTPRPREP